jgi:hypothetical protein
MIDLTEAVSITNELLEDVDKLNVRIAKAVDQGMFVNLAIAERESVIGPAKSRCPKIVMGVAMDPRTISGPRIGG